MRRFIVVALVAALVSRLGGLVQADEGKDAKAVIDKAIKALGGEDKLAKAKAITYKTKGKISLGGNESDITSTVTTQGIDHNRQEFEGEFNGNKVQGVIIVAGDKAWRKFGDDSRDLENEQLANQKRLVYLQVVGASVLPLKDKAFKVESVSEEKVGDKPAVAIKATGPDGKDFQLFFDKESGLPVKLVAKVAGRGGEEYTQETTYAKYKDFDGINVATRVETTRNGEKFIENDLSDFKVVDKVDAATFAQP
ncbi:MAG: hypothetical protein WD648_03700 [Planctomycetaceae bacterium]